MAALILALDCALQAAWAINVGDKDHARDYLDDGLEPSAKAFPERPDRAAGLAMVYDALLEGAAA